MSKWDYALGKPLSWDEKYLTPRYPQHVVRAFIAVASNDEGSEYAQDEPYLPLIERAINDFAKHWDGLGQDAFLRALQGSNRRDRLTALFAIGHDPVIPDAIDLLAPFLTSSDQLERCVAVCMLSLRRDERAFSGLEEYFLCEPPEDTQTGIMYTSDASIWYASYRSRVARLLATWGPAFIVEILRKAFIHLWELEKQCGGNVYDQDTQDALCYALGRRGVLAALHGIDLPDQQKHISMIYLGLGYVNADERFHSLYDALLFDSGLKQELATVFIHHFAFSQEESKEIIRVYPTDIEKRRYATYDLEAQDETPIIIKHSERADSTTRDSSR